MKTQLLHPWQVPTELRNFGVVMVQCGELQELIPSGIEMGIFLTVNQLKLLHQHYKFKLPDKKAGSGKGGRLVKKDYAEGIIDHFHPSCDASQRTAMFEGIMGKNWKHTASPCKHGKEILIACQALDSTDRPKFSELLESVTKDEAKLEEKRAARTDADGSHDTKKHSTPGILQPLLPEGKSYRLTRHPVLKRYQAFYTNDEGASFKPNRLFSELCSVCNVSSW